MHYALRTQRSWGSVSRDSWKIGERSRSERSRYEREQTTRYGTIWLETAERFSEPRVTHFQRGDVSIFCQVYGPPSYYRRFYVFTLTLAKKKLEERKKKWKRRRERRRNAWARRETEKNRGETENLSEARRCATRLSLERGCFAFDPVKTQRRDFLSLLDKFKLDWPCVQLNLWGSLRLKEQSMGCRVSTRNSL